MKSTKFLYATTCFELFSAFRYALSESEGAFETWSVGSESSPVVV